MLQYTLVHVFILPSLKLEDFKSPLRIILYVGAHMLHVQRIP